MVVEIQVKSLGMAVEIFDHEGKSIEDTGLPGELVCTRPHPSMPIRFWGDKNDEKYRKSYFDTYPGNKSTICHRVSRSLTSNTGVWRQGDFMVKNPSTKGLIILGRRCVGSLFTLFHYTPILTVVGHSDGVLNPSGVRFGSAEIYSVLEQFRDVLDDSLCVGQRRPEDKDERVLLFLKMRPGHQLSDSLSNSIREAIRKALSARHVPAYIFEIQEIPVSDQPNYCTDLESNLLTVYGQ